MESNLSKWKTWHKWVLGIIAAFIVLMIIAVNSPDTPKTKTEPPKSNTIDPEALIKQVKIDSTFKVTAAMVQHDTLFVAVSDADKGSENGNASYFINQYHLDSSNLTTCLIFISGNNPFSNAPKGIMVTDSKRDEITKSWEKQFTSALDGSCRPLETALKGKLNDADSYEHVESKYLYQPWSNQMQVFCKYRGKNVFGAKVLNSVVAELDMDGNVLEMKDTNE